ncbi:unnamed protein product [Lactuca virosa]|uniref:Uncharacterized protein n=1 Tax=Lactuca virosa TaxID=75947 RepID=A0AAU9LHP7_9ASTR|nr:unnamed protein product [Lactuca virosa]
MHIYSKTLHNSRHLMASFSRKTPWKNHLFSILFLAILLVVPTFSTSRRETITMSPDQIRRKNDAVGSNYRLRIVFSMLPKGQPVSPSAPSKRHNSVIGSTPQD